MWLHPIAPIRKGLDPTFEFKKLAFVYEASSMQHEENLVSAQSVVNNARKNSLQAAFSLFTTNLQNDTILQDKYLASMEMNSQRARSVLVASLEAQWSKPWLISSYPASWLIPNIFNLYWIFVFLFGNKVGTEKTCCGGNIFYIKWTTVTVPY